MYCADVENVKLVPFLETNVNNSQGIFCTNKHSKTIKHIFWFFPNSTFLIYARNIEISLLYIILNDIHNNYFTKRINLI